MALIFAQRCAKIEPTILAQEIKTAKIITGETRFSESPKSKTAKYYFLYAGKLEHAILKGRNKTPSSSLVKSIN